MSSSGNQLEGGLKSRHLTMLSIAGVIGGALFVGSGKVIANAGPAAILAYLGGGILVVLVMRMLGEMAVAQPDTGSFSTYADRAMEFLVFVNGLGSLCGRGHFEFMAAYHPNLGLYADCHLGLDGGELHACEKLWRI